MRYTDRMARKIFAAASGCMLLNACGASVETTSNERAAAAPPSAAAQQVAKPQPDLSGRTRVGVASFYASTFAGRQMADGVTMDPKGDNAASRTLPLGTVTRVTNISTGLSAVVVVEDRGPYVNGRIVDLSPATARRIGITTTQGIARVAVEPIAVAMPDGTFKPGSGAHAVKQPKTATAEWE